MNTRDPYFADKVKEYVAWAFRKGLIYVRAIPAT